MSAKAARDIREDGFKNAFQGYAIQAFVKFHMLRMRIQQAITGASK